MNIVKLMTQADVLKLIDQIGERAGDLQADIHTAAFNTLDHARVHGDYTGITRLLDKLPKGQRVKALAYWYGHFSNGRVSLSVDADTKLWRVNKDKFGGRSDVDFDMIEAEKVSFADLTVEKDPKTLSLEKFIASLARTATNAANFDGTDVPKVSPATRALASKLVAFIKQDAATQAEVAAQTVAAAVEPVAVAA